MSNHEEWNEFLYNLMNNTLEKRKETKEYEYLRQCRVHIDEMLTSNLRRDEKDMVDEVMFEVGLAAEHETAILYRQGLKDCVWLLKNLGVLA